MKENKKKNRNILKFLIFLGLIAIFFSLYIKDINPFFRELVQRGRDKKRIDNFSLLNSVLGEAQKNNPDLFLGDSNTVYVSLPSADADCGSLKLPSLSKQWRYACKPEESYRKIDGNGWLPVDFTKLTDNISLLPIDPINTVGNEQYYTYVAGEGFALLAQTESNKYLETYALKDDGIYSNKFETGSDLNIIKDLKLAEKLGAYWDFNEGEGETLKDYSGNNNEGKLTDSTEDNKWVSGIAGTALNFDGVDDYASVKDHPNIQNIFKEGGSISVWIKPRSTGQGGVGRIIQKDNDIDSGWIFYLLSEAKGKTKLGFLQRFSSGNEDWVTHNIIPLDSWTHIVLVYKNALGDNPMIYINGENVDIRKTTGAGGNATSDEGIKLYIGNNTAGTTTFDGFIDEITIYSSMLSEKEVKFLYESFNK